jgi:23S rRNA G2445 N2-methylase RlmL
MSFVQQSVDVKDLLGDGQGGLLTLSVQVVMTGKSREVGAKSSDLTHSKFTALSIKNALCDSVRARRGDRPDVDPDDPDVPLVAFVRDSSVSLYRQLHVGSLHRRGYRSDAAIHKAAMKESLAAGLLMHAGWNDRILAMKEESIEQQPQVVLVDPMAGSGTLVLEAVLMAADVAPGLLRASCSISNPERFPGHLLPPVTRWKHPSGDESAISAAQIWKDELVEASHRAKTGIGWLRSSNSVRFFANDYHPGAIDLIESSLREASQVVPGLDSLVEVHQGDCEDWIPVVTSSDNGKFDSSLDQRWMVVCNPPWGERLSEDMHESWESLRAFLRGGTCPPRTEAWILSGNPAATKHLGLQRSSSLPVRTGQQDLRWLQYEIRDKSPSFSASSFQPSQSRKEKETTAHSVPRVKTSRTERLQKASVANSRKAPAAKFKQDRPNRNRSAASRTNPQPTKRSKSASENEWLI